MDISAIVLASGFSKRMARDKLHMEIKNKKIYEYIMETINNHNFYEVLIISNDSEIISKANKLKYKAFNNPDSHLGQSSSIKVALKNVNNSSGYLFFVADQPLISSNTIKLLCDEHEQNLDKIIIPSYNSVNGSPVLFPSSFKNELMSIKGDSGGKSIINNNIDKVIKVQIDNDYELMDVDTMEDYENILKIEVIEW